MGRTAVALVLDTDELDLESLPGNLSVVHTVHGSPSDDGASLDEALACIDSGQARALLVFRLGSVATSLGELVRLLDWLGQRGASLIALDMGLDTEQRAGRVTAGVLRELQRWAREPARPRWPSGRPGLQRVSPELAERIGAMRAKGLSLQAIADSLNADGLPTPRGGARWRPSSVQTVLGYRRPQPPGPRPGQGPPGQGPPGPGRSGPPRPGAGGPPRPGHHRRPGPAPGRPQ